MKQKKIKSKALFLLIFMFVFQHFLISLDPNKRINQYLIDLWSNKDGLPQNSITSILQTRKGYIWLGTQEGVVSFDGLKMTTYSAKNVAEFRSSAITALEEDNKNSIWIGTFNGLLRFENEKFSLYTTDDGLIYNLIRCLKVDRADNLWIGTENGICKLEEGIFKKYIFQDKGLSNQVKSIINDKEGNIWTATKDEIYKLINNKFLAIDLHNKLENNIQTIYIDSSNTLWIGTVNSGLYSYTKSKLQHYGIKDNLSGNYITTISEDKNGNLWIGTYNGGLNRLYNNQFSSLTEKDGLSNNFILSILEDREANLWIGTSGMGLNRLRDGKVTVFGPSDGLISDDIGTVFEDSKGNLWVGSRGGVVYKLKEKILTVYNLKDCIAGNAIRTLGEDPEGNIWIGTAGNGICVLENEKSYKISVKDGFKNKLVYSILKSSDDIMWVGTDSGISRYKENRFENITIVNGIPLNSVRIISEDKNGNIWFSSEGRGIVKYDHRDFTFFDKEDGLGSNIGCALYFDADNIPWIGTYGGGLSWIQNNKIKTVTIRDGLSDNIILTILESQGKLWMSCNNGIFSVDKDQLIKFGEGKLESIDCTEFNESSGMINRECNGGHSPAGWKDKDGILWFPTIKGLVMIDPTDLKTSGDFPVVNIEKINVDGRPLNLNKEIVEIAPGYKRVEFYYTGLSFINSKNIQFKVRLTGLDKEWVNMDTSRRANYTHVSPGVYTFEVISTNSEGRWNNQPIGIKIHLKAFFFQTLLFYILVVFFILFSGFLFFKQRVISLQKRKTELEKEVKIRTEEIIQKNIELEKLSIVASKTNSGVMIMDWQGKIEWVNEGLTRMYGVNPEQLVNGRRNTLLELSANPNIKQYYEHCTKKKETVVYETHVKAYSGKKIWVQTTLTPILDSNGMVKKTIAIDSDITKIKEAEKAAEMANQAKSDFLARMSHEIRTPMNGIIGFIEMLVDTNLNKEQIEFARTISRSGEALIFLLNDILDFSKIEAGELTFDPIDFDPELTVFDICDLVQPRIGTKPVEILCRIGETVPAFIKTDPSRFRQVIVNLMGNAAKFTKKGEIELSLEFTKEKNNRLQLHIKIRDTGIGIPQNKIESIFNVFHQANDSTARKYGGTGLGLSICRQISRLMGGEVWGESQLGKGSTFHFTCWVDKSDKRPTKRIRYHHLEGRRALIVDDNPTNLEILTHTLELSKMEVIKLTDPNELLPKIKESLNKNQPVDICIIDIQMPKISGYDLAREIRNQKAPICDIPLLAFSSFTSPHSKHCQNAGFTGYLPKPIRRNKLILMVEWLLRSKETIKIEKPSNEIITQHTINEESKHSLHILLAEDNPINQKLTRFILEKGGYHLTISNNGKEVVKTFLEKPEAYDMILMDIQMPEMDGREATKKIRENGFKNIPIIAITAEAMKGDKEKCLKAGMDDYIAKPIKRDKIFEMVKKYVLNK